MVERYSIQNIIYGSRFDQWKSLNLFTDNQGVIRSRLPETEKSEFDQRHPVFTFI